MCQSSDHLLDDDARFFIGKSYKVQRRIQSPDKRLWWSFHAKIVNDIQPLTISARTVSRGCLTGLSNSQSLNLFLCASPATTLLVLKHCLRYSVASLNYGDSRECVLECIVNPTYLIMCCDCTLINFVLNTIVLIFNTTHKMRCCQYCC